jgi:hypothetical protein
VGDNFVDTFAGIPLGWGFAESQASFAESQASFAKS